MATKKTENKQETKKTDVKYLEAHVENLKKHLSKNKLDNPTKRALGRKEAKLKKLREYLAK